MSNEYPDIGRVALRVEGPMWNAYWAPSQTSMEGAVLLGTIRMEAVKKSDRAKQSFIALMKIAFEAEAEAIVGSKVEWGDVKPAPERERAGHG